MKRIALLTFAMLLGIFCYAQSEHLKFSGIPIGGTINQFQEKLVHKGYSLDRLINSRLSIGSRAFKGKFIGKNVLLYVYYDEHTKIVYRVKAVMQSLSESIADQRYQEIQTMLLQKYDNGYSDEGQHERKPSLSIFPKRYKTYSDEEYDWTKCYGKIDVFISKDESYINYPYMFNVHIDYWDQLNLDKHNKKLLDEL